MQLPHSIPAALTLPLILTPLVLSLGACRTGATDKSDEVGADTGPLVSDNDGDGFSADEDCDDEDASVNPGATEICDGVDNDCDDEVDEEVTAQWYGDADGDGYGDPETIIEACSRPDGAVASATDCDDDNAAVYPSATEICNEIDDDCDGDIDEGVTSTWYADTDGDGYGDAAVSVEGCEQPEGYVEDATDCDDSTADAHPDALEVCDDIDNDCDGDIDEETTHTWYLDADGDGYGDGDSTAEACDIPSGYADNPDDCDDADFDVNPDATEVCDEIDNDCDGTVDESDASDASTWYDDSDGDGYGDASASQLACDQPTGTVADDTDCDDSNAAVNPSETELCNSIDDDCDGTVDESDAADASTWYIDADSDSYGSSATSTVDCNQPSGYVDNDDDCDDSDASINPSSSETWYDGTDYDCDGDDDPDPCGTLPGSTTVTDDPTCTYLHTSPSNWSVVTEWTTESMTYSAGSNYTRIMMTPAVGQLTDDDGDGDVDEYDIPDIVYNTFRRGRYRSAGYLRVMSGDGSGEHWSLSSVSSGGTTHYVHSSAGVAIGDLEGDGWPDIVTISTGAKVIALEGDGTLKWVSSVSASSGYAQPAIHDLDGDGSAEVIAGTQVLDSTGAQVFAMGNVGHYGAFAADFDDDGDLDAMAGGDAWDSSGTMTLSSSASNGKSAVVNLDADDYAELIVRYNTTVWAIDDVGSTLWTATTDTGQGAPCVGDMDGDGSPEIGVSGRYYFDVFDSSGTRLWRNTVYDTSSRSAGCSVYDFDGDGASEVILADQTDLYVWDGATGAELWSHSSHASGTIWEYAFVADVDNDGNAEMVVPNNDYAFTGWDGLYVLGEENDEWASAMATWNQFTYHVDNVNEDASLPTSPTLPWTDHNSFRGQVAWSDEAAGSPDIDVYVLGACEDCSAGSLEFYAAVSNIGAVFIPSGLDVALYAVDGTTLTLLEVQQTTDRIDPGERLAPMSFTVDTADVGADGLLVVADDDGTYAGIHNECDEGNNEEGWDALSCP